MTPSQRKLARQALGLPNARNCSNRNLSFVPMGAPISLPWLDMLRKHEALLLLPSSEYGLFFFSLTYTSALAALDKGETLDPEDFPETVGGASGE